MYAWLGDREQALANLAQALSIEKEVGNRIGEAVIRHAFALVHRADGKLDEAIRELELSEDLYRQVSHPNLGSITAELERVRQERAQRHE